MALTLEQLQEARDSLILKIAGGRKRVQFSDGREVENATSDEMQNALKVLDAEIAAAQSTPRRRTVVSSGKGY